MFKSFSKTATVWAALGLLAVSAGHQVIAGVTTTVDIVSNATQDGYVAATAAGGTATSNSTAATSSALRIGDSELFFIFFDILPDRAYRSVLSFGTNAIPPGATIDAAELFITRGATTGAITANFGTAEFSVKTGQFGNNANIETADFNAAPTAAGGALAIGAGDGSQTSTVLSGPALAAINQSGGPNSGITQIKIQYPTLTNNDRGADYIGFYSGNAANAAQRPFLRVTYTVPDGSNLVASPGNVDFFDVDVDSGPSADEIVTITNLGTDPVAITSISLTGADAGEFAITDDSGEGSLAQNESRTLTLNFDPSTPGQKNAQISIVNDLPSSPLTVDLTGFGSNKAISVNFPDLNFGIQDVDAGPTFAREVVITNSGNTDLTINEVSIDGTDFGDFLIQNDTGEGTLAPAATRTFDVVFDPNFPISAKTANLNVLSDATNTPTLSVPLNGSAATASRRPFGDFDDSGCTDVNDFLFLLDNWQLDFQGTPMNINDFLNLLDNWQAGPSCPVIP